MIDDLKFIHERDAQDALGVAEKQWQQLKQTYGVDTSALRFGEVTNVIVGGMGGSALAATLFTSWPRLTVPYEVVRSYSIPAHVNEHTLFIASSYSGNTEETLEALAAAEARGAQIVVIAAGGKLAEIATEKNYPFYQIPTGYQPRMAVYYNFAALVELFDGSGLTKGTVQELHETADWLSHHIQQWLPTVPASQNKAKQFAQEMLGRSVVVYAGPVFSPVAYKWKINVNENAKQVAWAGQYPEFNHNEFLGWTKQPVDKPYAVIDIRSNFEHERIQKRFEISERLLSGMRPAPEIVVPEGETLLKQLFWTIVLGDFASLYLALLNNLNPTPVVLIEKLKQALTE